MGDLSFRNHFVQQTRSLRYSNENIPLYQQRWMEAKKLSSSSAIDIADSGVASMATPLSSMNDNKTAITSSHECDDSESTQSDNRTVNDDDRLSIDIIKIGKPILIYKQCQENTQYSNCLVTYLDHPSAIFIQIPDEGAAFQQMHQDMNRHYMDNLHGYTGLSMTYFDIGNYCVAYSNRYLEFFRGRILNIDSTHQQFLIIFVDFGNSEWVHIKGMRPLRTEFSNLKIQSIPVTLSHILPKKDPFTGIINWDTNLGKQCTRKLRRQLIQPENEPFLFVSITFWSNVHWWPLPLVDIKLDGQDLAEILHSDGLARFTRDNRDLRLIYSDFGTHLDEQLIFGIQQPKQFENNSTDHHL